MQRAIKYDTDTRRFILSLDDTLNQKQIAEKLGISYKHLHYTYRVNFFSKAIFYSIITAFNLSDEKKLELKKLLK